MRAEDKIELHEAMYRQGKQIKENDQRKLARDRIAELRAIDTRSISLEEQAQIDNEIEDITLFLKRNKWQ